MKFYQLILELLVCCGLVSWTSLATSLPNTCNETRSAVSSQFSLWDHLPKEWCEICEVDYGTDNDVNASVICHVTPRDQAQWRLADLRTALTAAMVDSMHLELAVDIRCQPGGAISLPFPMRAPALVRLHVLNCRLLDKLADSREAVTTPTSHRDWMREMVLDSCTWINDPLDHQFVSENLQHLSKDLECGQDSTLVTYVYRNVSEETLPRHDPFLETSWESLPAEGVMESLAPPASARAEDRHGAVGGLGNRSLGGSWGGGRDGEGDGDGSAGGGGLAPVGLSGSGQGGQQAEMGISGEFLQGQIQLTEMEFWCRFDHLEVLEESFNPLTSNIHFELLTQNSRYPELRVLNYSATGLTHVPRELRNFRRYFPYSTKLGIIDLSHNWIRRLGPLFLYRPDSRRLPITLVLHFNNITEISLDMFKEWALVGDFYVDIRYNPINCHCGLKDLLGHLQSNDSLWEGPAMTYYKGQLSDMTCAMPPELYGKVIGSLGIEDLPCSKSLAAFGPALVALLLVTSLLLALVILMLRYRREVRILFYTRVHFLTPCPCLSTRRPGSRHPSRALGQEEEEDVKKLYDAFVAYAHQDSPWVLDSLVPRLEQSSSSSSSSSDSSSSTTSSGGGGGGGSVWRRRPRPCRLCLHQRDFVVGKPIIDNIVDSIAASRHTIVVLSRSFVRSGWAMEELYQAYQQSLAERRRHLVLVVLEHVPVSEMAPVLRRCCHTFTYLSVSDTLFWDRLVYSIHTNDQRSDPTTKPSALEANAPTKKKDKKRKKNHQSEDNRNTTTDNTETNHAKGPRNIEDNFLQHGGNEDIQHENGGNKGDNAFQDGGGAGQDSSSSEDVEIDGLGVDEDLKKRAIFSEAMRSMSMESARTSSTSDSSASVPLSFSQQDWERPLILEEV